ncbi:MAG: VTT domain-containing protein [Candidatus Woesearchaeota archaeon]
MSITSILLKFLEIVLHLDKYLGVIIAQYGLWTYLILFGIIFAETGFVFTPFLPGDSLLFASGTMAGMGLLNIWILFLIFVFAAILGDTCNYWIGEYLGLKFLKKSRWINKRHVEKTEKFFNKYGPETIILARFMPIVRTFAPFLAGVARMNYWKFLMYNVIGAVLWVSLFTFGGYYFGGLEFVKNNFSLVLIIMIILSFMPLIVHFVKDYFFNKKNKIIKNKKTKTKVKN